MAVINLNENWLFEKEGQTTRVNLPHTWNALDGQDGGNDYYRGVCRYYKKFPRPNIPQDGVALVEFKGVNSSCKISLNGVQVALHDGGYSAFTAVVTHLLKDENLLEAEVDNSPNERVYPQTADFTFYGGIYRDVNLIILEKLHFDRAYWGVNGLKLLPCVNDGKCTVTPYVRCDGGRVEISVYDQAGNLVASGQNERPIDVANAKLWEGVKSPYLYTACARLYDGQRLCDEISAKFGFRTIALDPKKGFILNGKPYPLRGVCRHQDRKGLGNAITETEHREDMRLILETGANTVRLAHYQHDDLFYDLCDEYGLVVWAEIPYISRHMPRAHANAQSQLTELITRQFNHPSIVCWGISNEITMFRRHRKDMLRRHTELNELCHRLDPTRFTTLACFAMCSPFNKVGKITDAVSWNLYLGWYVPGLFLNKVWYKIYRIFNPKRVFGFSEYGAEGMPNLHAVKPKRGDNSEEYQFKYHEYMLNFFNKHPEFWATHCWNMFDFAADARDQGGEPGMNHKGLVTFDRKIKKDAFYLYKAYFSDSPFIHLCGKRFINRTGKKLQITVCTNLPQAEVFVNGKSLGVKSGPVLHFSAPMEDVNKIRAVSGEFEDGGVVVKVKKPDPSYILKKTNTKNWQKEDKK